MPVDMPNRKLFKPCNPKAIDRHFLFGFKFFKVHQFKDPKWTPYSITHQYSVMASCLKKNLQYKKFKLAAHSDKQLKRAQILKQECIDGRTRIKNAYIGDVTTIRRILMKRKDLQRKYKTMPLEAIMENCDQETFLRRKENDRLKYQLNKLSNKLKEALLEQSKIEDRIKYANEFQLQTEIDAKTLRKDLKNSETRIQAYKLITRAYQRIVTMIKKDDIYFESVLDAIESDIVEQQNFIHQIVLLGVPARSEYSKLADDFRDYQDTSRKETKTFAVFVGDIRKKLANLQKDTKFVVRNYVPVTPHQYLRTTRSMDVLKSNIEELETIINEIRLVTMSPDAETIEYTMRLLLKNCDTFDQKNRLDDNHRNSLLNQSERAKSQMSVLIHSFTPAEAERMQNIDDLQLQIKYQKKLKTQVDQQIVNSGNMLHMLCFSLWNIIDVLRYVGKKIEPIPKDYPNIDLKLPLLKFDFLDLKSVPPIEYERSSQKLLILAKDRIRALVTYPLYKAVISDQELKINRKKYHVDYMKLIEEEEGVTQRLSTQGDVLGTIVVDPNVLTRGFIKETSAKIVEKNAKKDTDT